jgi:hypothetical protein
MILGVLALGGYSAGVWAQDNAALLPGQPFQSGEPKSSPQASSDNSGESSDLGGRFKAQTNLMRTYTSNMYYAADGQDKVKAWGWALQPGVLYTDDLPRLHLIAGLNGTLASYNTPGQHDDYADGSLSLGAHWAPLQFDRINLDTSYGFGHDPFGTNRTEGAGITTPTASSPDKWGNSSASLDWQHGSSFRGLLTEAKVSYVDRTYLNNKDATKYENYNAVTGEGALYYAFSPKTQLLGDFAITKFRQPNTFASFADQSALQYQVLAGGRWYASAKFFTDVRGGWVRRQFDNNSRPDFNGASWAASATWTPQPYRVFALETGRRSDPSYLPSAGFINTSYVQTQWMENWTSRLYTRVVGNYVHSNFVDTARHDNNYFGALFVNYSVSRSLDAFIISAFGRRNSEDGSLDYSRADVFAGIKYVFFSNL